MASWRGEREGVEGNLVIVFHINFAPSFLSYVCAISLSSRTIVITLVCARVLSRQQPPTHLKLNSLI